VIIPGLTVDKADGLLSFDILFSKAAAVLAALALELDRAMDGVRVFCCFCVLAIDGRADRFFDFFSLGPIPKSIMAAKLALVRTGDDELPNVIPDPATTPRSPSPPAPCWKLRKRGRKIGIRNIRKLGRNAQVVFSVNHFPTESCQVICRTISKQNDNNK
jgi:hypothetical protein